MEISRRVRIWVHISPLHVADELVPLGWADKRLPFGVSHLVSVFSRCLIPAVAVDLDDEHSLALRRRRGYPLKPTISAISLPRQGRIRRQLASPHSASQNP